MTEATAARGMRAAVVFVGLLLCAVGIPAPAAAQFTALAACETGLGDLKVGDGVYGLRRAFELAGARNVLMSLFKVPDAETRELLADFYGGLAKGLKPRAAFRAAQLAQRNRHPHPLYWASFVLVGRD